MTVEDIFLAAVEKVPAERAAYLDAACGPDAVLRAHVEALLRSHEKAGSLLEQPLFRPAPTADQPPPAEGSGGAVGPYKLVQEIGEGGMGTVYLARQQEPVKRLVALKVIKAGMDSRAVLARFEAERQALALMDHPNIAKVLDAGTTPPGRPYFVMELVKGTPITKYCDDQRLPLRDRLTLFADVCRAVQHAHQKGIIHRDIKPSNVLVAPYDGRPVVKVIDFGVAKAAGQPLTEKTLVTGFGAVVGTPEYMSPEQAELNNQDIDTRSDVYSLGVLLYELLTGTTPLTKQRLQQAALLEVLRLVREEDAPRPSTRLSTTAELPAIAAARGLEPRKLSGAVRGELDWIVMRALEKDRTRRYETASGLALDVQRYLADEPVLACPPSAGYRLRKFARRNKARLAVAGACLFFAVALVGVAGWAVRDRQARRAKLAGDLTLAVERVELFHREGKLPEALTAYEAAAAFAADPAADPAVRDRLQALKAQMDADAQDRDFVARFEAVLLEELTRVDVRRSTFALPDMVVPVIKDLLSRYGIEVGVTSVDQAAARVRGRPEGVRASLVAALHELLGLDRRPDSDARPWLIAVLNAADHDPWRVRVRQAISGSDRQALERLVGEADVDRQPPSFLIRVSSVLPSAAARLQLFRRMQRAHPADFWANESLASALVTASQASEAIRYYTAALALRPNNAGVYVNRGLAFQAAGEWEAALADYRRAIAIAPDYAAPRNNLGLLLVKRGETEAAITAYREALAVNPGLAEPYIGLAGALLGKGDKHGAADVYRSGVAARPDDPRLYHGLGHALAQLGDVKGAVAAYRKVTELGAEPGTLRVVHYDLGCWLARDGDLDAAVEEIQRAVAQGYSDMSHMMKDPDLDPLRQREDFQKVLKSLSPELHRLEGHTGRVRAVALSPDGRHALTGGVDRTVRLWDVETGKELRRFEGHTGEVLGVAFSPDGRRALSGATDQTVRLWDVEGGREVQLLRGHGSAVWSVAFSPDGRRALTGGGDDRTVRWWDLESGMELVCFKEHTGTVRSAACHPGGKLALSGGADKVVRLWEIETGKEVAELKGHTLVVTGVAFSPDGRRALTGSNDGTMRLWEVPGGTAVRTVRHPRAGVEAVAFSADGRRALTTSQDNVVYWWDLETGQRLRAFPGHTGTIHGVAYGTDGRVGLSGGGDGTARVWKLAVPQPAPK